VIMVGMVWRDVGLQWGLSHAACGFVPGCLLWRIMPRWFEIAFEIEWGVVGMKLRACGVSMTSVVTGEARRPSPKSPWSGGLGEGFLRRLAWASVLLSMSPEFLLLSGKVFHEFICSQTSETNFQVIFSSNNIMVQV